MTKYKFLRCLDSGIFFEYIFFFLVLIIISREYKTDNRTRGHKWAVAKERCKLDIRKYRIRPN